MTTTVIGRRYQSYSTKGSMGVWSDTRFLGCWWPRPEEPTAIFAEGSAGLIVGWGATPRNIIFPDDTIFEPYWPDGLYPAEQAVLRFSSTRRGMVDLSPEEVAIWQAAYDAAVTAIPATAARNAPRPDVHFIIHRSEIGRDAKGRPIMEEFVGEITLAEAKDIAAGRLSADAIKETKEFVSLSEMDPLDGTRPKIVPGVELFKGGAK